MNFEAELKEAKEKKIQPYYAIFNLCHGRKVDSFEGRHDDYITWNNDRHSEFWKQSKAQNFFPYGEKYEFHFTEHLKEYLQKILSQNNK